MSPRSKQIILTQRRKLAKAYGPVLLRELPIIENRLREAGLFETAMLMRKVVQKSGYEFARLIGPKPAVVRKKP